MSCTGTTTLEQARAAKPRAAMIFNALAAVVGVGVTRMNGGYAVKVNLAEEPAQGTTLPNDVDGVPVQVEVVGRIEKL